MLRAFAKALIAIGAVSTACLGQNASVEQEVKAAEDARRAAVLRGDKIALDRLMADDYMVITIAGTVANKAEELALYENDQRRTESWDAQNVRIRVYGEAAVVTGLASVTDNLRGQARRIRFRYMHVWVKRDRRWRIVSRQATTSAAE